MCFFPAGAAHRMSRAAAQPFRPAQLGRAHPIERSGRRRQRQRWCRRRRPSIHGHRAHRRWNRLSRAGPIRRISTCRKGVPSGEATGGEFVTALLRARCRGTVRLPSRIVGSMSEVAEINGATVTGDLPLAALPARGSIASPDLKMAATDLATLSTPIAANRLTMNALSSAGGKATAMILQAGI
jgi:hypothetical protein